MFCFYLPFTQWANKVCMINFSNVVICCFSPFCKNRINPKITWDSGNI